MNSYDFPSFFVALPEGQSSIAICEITRGGSCLLQVTHAPDDLRWIAKKEVTRNRHDQNKEHLHLRLI